MYYSVLISKRKEREKLTSYSVKIKSNPPVNVMSIQKPMEHEQNERTRNVTMNTS